uniref:Uncharacterized protein n=1 Tax=Seriola lalandi dorsalis TaxID=1841481 RepID=A0A3B4XEV5_SERLL
VVARQLTTAIDGHNIFKFQSWLLPLALDRNSVIAVVIFVTVSALAIMARFICSRKETYRNQEVKAAQPEDSHEFPFSSQADSQSAPSENQKEYFI